MKKGDRGKRGRQAFWWTVALAVTGGWLVLASCGDREPSGLEAGFGDGPENDSAVAESPATLAYQESVRAGMDDLKLVMSFVDEEGEKQQWEGQWTMVKDRFATVEHSSPQQKTVDLRRWATVHLIEIPESGEPRVNRTEDSPLTGWRLAGDRLGTGEWRYRFADLAAVPEHERERFTLLLEELNRVEVGVAAFYEGHDLDLGKSWQVPVTALVRWFGDEVGGYVGDINVKVDRVEDLQGQSCAVMEVAFKATGKMRDPDGQSLDMAMEARGEVWRALELREDLKVDIQGSMTLKAAVSAQEIEMVVAGPLAIREERKLRL